jgi:hypothetical protein
MSIYLENEPKYCITLQKFFEYLNRETKNELTMGIGFSEIEPIDTERNLIFDITLSNYQTNDIEEYLKAIEFKNETFIFNYDFNNMCVLSNGIITRFNKINKIKSIIFDSSTFKFLRNIKFIGILYYLVLEKNGSIYIESNAPASHGFIINNLTELYENTKCRNKHFRYPTVFLISNYLMNYIPPDKISEIEKNIFTKEDIYSNNIEYLKNWFYGSKIELIDDELIPYPITNPRYPIKKYYKITKMLDHDKTLEFIKSNIKMYNDGLNMSTSSTVIKQTDFN